MHCAQAKQWAYQLLHEFGSNSAPMAGSCGEEI
jgi:hypothetical protein